jgi:topoisomerase-4 subunit A
MILLSAASNPLVKIDILKGKSNIEESIEQNLTEIIDVKVMRAQGNRLSVHEVQNIELLTTEEEEVDVEEVVSETEAGGEKTKAAVGLEITNPDDVDIDDSGQIGLF